MRVPARTAVVWREQGGTRIVRGRGYPEGDHAEWGSITKAATARAVAGCVAEGLLAEDDAVADLLDVPLPGVRVHDLLRHTAGLPSLHRPARPWRDPTRGVDDLDLRRLAGLQEPTEVGRYRYSNLGYAFVGEILDRCCPNGWWGAVQDHVATPYGLSSLTLAPGDERILLRGVGPGQRRPWRLAATRYRSAGGLWSGLEDLALLGERAGVEGVPWALGSGWQTLGDGSALVTGRTRDTDACVLVHRATGDAVAVHSLVQRPGHAARVARMATTVTAAG